MILRLVSSSVRRYLTLIILLAAFHGQWLHASAGSNAEGPKSGGGAIDPLLAAPSSAGSNPSGVLLSASDGTFYGVTDFESFGNDNFGSVFHMDSGGNVTTLTIFDGNDGMSPEGGVVFGTDGNLYGSTNYGANGYTGSAYTGYGTLFSISTSGSNFTTLWSFTGGADGANPHGELILGTDGNFYGTTYQGGVNNGGVVFQLVPNGASSQVTPLWSFSGDADGANPGGLIPLGSGTFYGVTSTGGPGGFGTIFSLVTTGSAPVLTTLTSFNGYNGSSPTGIILGPGGNFFGSTSGGGSHGFGTLFMVTPTGQLTTLFSFDGANGAEPNDLLYASDGNIYGTTFVGGAKSGGTFFRLASAGKVTTLYSFNPIKGAIWGGGSLVEGLDHTFYGADGQSGATGGGAIFNLAISGKKVKLIDMVDFSQQDPFMSTAAVRAINVTKHSATLVGIINPNGVSTNAQFEISTNDTQSEGHYVGATYSQDYPVGSGTRGLLFKVHFTGLAESTTYYFQLDASNVNNYFGNSTGPAFSTPGRPTITYNAPTSITSASAVVSAEINPRGHASTAYFEYGPTISYGSKSPKTNVGSGIVSFPLNFEITGLAPNTEYHYRIVAKSALGTVDGSDQTIITTQ